MCVGGCLHIYVFHIYKNKNDHNLHLSHETWLLRSSVRK